MRLTIVVGKIAAAGKDASDLCHRSPNCTNASWCCQSQAPPVIFPTSRNSSIEICWFFTSVFYLMKQEVLIIVSDSSYNIMSSSGEQSLAE
jgi:hypothetical protein